MTTQGIPHVSVDELVEQMQQEFPRFRIVHKRDSTLNKFIDVLLRLVTFGAQSSYMTQYHTVLGDTLYVPDRWDDTPEPDQWITLRHERVHLRQRRRYGTLLMSFLYLVPFLPLGLAYGRARIEWEAYRESLRATARVKGLEVASSEEFRAYIVEQFTSGAYGWMWPFPKSINRWLDTALAEFEQDQQRTPTSTEQATTRTR
jgi:hypothetical protein